MIRHRRALATLVAIGLAVSIAPLASASSPAGEAAAPAGAKPVINGVFPVDGEPSRITLGPDGNMWFGVGGNSGGNDLGKINPAGQIEYFDVPGISTGLGSLVVGPDKNLWATHSTGVVKIPVANPTGATSFAITGFTEGQGIAVGPDKNLWAASDDTLYKVPLADPTTATPYDVAGMASRQVTATSDRIWVADFTGKVHAFKTDGTFVSTTVGGSPQGIVAGTGGQVLYSNPENNNNHAARLVLGGTPKKTPLPNTDPSSSVAFGEDQAYWVGLFLTRQVARITPEGKLTKLAGTFPAPYLPRYVATGPKGKGTIWLSLQDPGQDGAIGRVTGLDLDSKATVTLKGKRVQVEAGKAQVRLKCPGAEKNGPCKGKVTLKSLAGKKPTLGNKSYSIKSGKVKTVKVGLKQATVNQIGSDGLQVLAVIKVKDKAGNKKTIRTKIRLVR